MSFVCLLRLSFPDSAQEPQQLPCPTPENGSVHVGNAQTGLFRSLWKQQWHSWVARWKLFRLEVRVEDYGIMGLPSLMLGPWAGTGKESGKEEKEATMMPEAQESYTDLKNSNFYYLCINNNDHK